MKDAKGHGSNYRGGAAHQASVEQVGQHEVRSINQLRPTQDPNTNAPIGSQQLTLSTGNTFDLNRIRGGDKNKPLTREANQAIIDRYRAKIQAGAPVDPILITEGNHIIDGAHRHAAYRAEGVKHVPVEVMKGARIVK